jgi:hypothetical protein
MNMDTRKFDAYFKNNLQKLTESNIALQKSLQLSCL